MTTIFDKIIKKELPADIVFENETLMAFKDIHPQAPVHILLVPKKSIRDVASLSPEDGAVIGEIFLVAQKLAEEFGLDNGYRIITNTGSDSGQLVPHLHFHLLGGRKLGPIG